MTKRIKDFGVPIEGRRKGRKRRSLAKSMKRNREDDSINLDNAYHGANKVKEAQGIYSTEEEQARKPWGRKMQYQVPKLSSVRSAVIYGGMLCGILRPGPCAGDR